MSNAWNYIGVGLLAIAAGAGVIFGEPASAELRLAEAATTAAAAGAEALCLFAPAGAAPASPLSTQVAVPAVD